MDTTALKNFAQKARVDLIHQVGAQLKLVLASDSLARREEDKAVRELEARIERKGKEVVVEEVAYTWFNRFCALRFMDVNRYSTVGVVSPSDAQTQPEILSDAKMGVFDENVVSNKTKEKVLDLLSGRLKSKDAQGEAYRLLLVSYCNHLNRTIPYLFERITDYTELLLPTNLLAVNSILAECRDAMTEDACKDVEVIGWLYQYYISEKKDDVFKNFKKGKKAGPREIPAATQLFTPHWIVRYLVENSLGRLWMLNHPRSNLIEKMEYYIKPEQEETDFLRITKPEEIKVCDPACGSGHMLTYAFDLLYAMYEEQGYSPSSIPSLILKHNLYGIEIDKRAGELAAFALTMKARQKSRRFFSNPVEPKVRVLEKIHFDQDELKGYMDHIGRDLFTSSLQATLKQFEEADNFGSLIQPEITDVQGLISILESKNISEQLFLSETHQKVLKALHQADYLSPRYHVVVANPPYMDINNVNVSLKQWSTIKYPLTFSNLFSLFIERCSLLCMPKGTFAMITMQAWMFLKAHYDLRKKILNDYSILSMAHLGENAFDKIEGEVVSTTAFIIGIFNSTNYEGSYIRLVEGDSENVMAEMFLKAINREFDEIFFRTKSSVFHLLPGSPISYWASMQLRKIFNDSPSLSVFAEPRKGMVTADNPRFIRLWNEVSNKKIGLNCHNREEAKKSARKWFPYLKGGAFRRWYGNLDYIINWENDGFELLNMKGNGYKVGSTNHNLEFIFKPAITWTKITSGLASFRSTNSGFLFDDASGLCPILDYDMQPQILSVLNSPVIYSAICAINPTMNINPGNLANLPIVLSFQSRELALKCEIFSKCDWDSYETSWDFTTLPLLDNEYRQATLTDTYTTLRTHRNEMTLEMQRLEEENNRIFIEAYGLEDELSPDVPLKEITLTCNPYYRYGNNKSDSELEELLLADTMKELISYAVGCMFGRYSLDKPGLILANQGETYEDYCRLVPGSSFPADEDNAIPVLDGDWFSDDIVMRFRKFLRVAFGEEKYEENLRFIEKALGKDLRQYFLKDFYNDHVRRYKKRPIYWMFSSPNGSFNVLIYMHRYRPDTASIVLNEYLREYQVKLSSYMESLRRKEGNPDLSKGEKVKALKELDKLRKTQDILATYERDVLFPLANQRIEIDLDDGVKVNYPKFGTALKKVPGLEAKE